MDIDFHFYGTYVAAREAEFQHEEAIQIAMAAQMVDQCTPNYLQNLLQAEHDNVSTSTTESQKNERKMEDIATCADNYFNNSYYIKSDDSFPAIWMPFHFLPGNLKQELEKFDSELLEEKNIKEEYNNFKCICLTNSSLVKQMIDETKVLFHKYKEDERRYNVLLLIGIRMHVLADTWAHEYFVGINSRKLNGFTDYESVGEMSLANKILGAPDLPEYLNAQIQLGHAQAGHWPDLGNITYSYRPSWMKSDYRMIKKNPEVFMNAFNQMVQAMKCIKNEEPFECRERSKFIIEKKENNKTYVRSCFANEIKNELYELICKSADNNVEDWIEYVNQYYAEFKEDKYKSLNEAMQEVARKQRNIVELVNELYKETSSNEKNEEHLAQIEKTQIEKYSFINECTKIVKDALEKYYKKDDQEKTDKAVAYIWTFQEAAKIHLDLVDKQLQQNGIRLYK